MGLALIIIDCLALGFAIWLDIRLDLVRYVIFAVIGMRLIADSFEYLRLKSRTVERRDVNAPTPTRSAMTRGRSLISSTVSVVSPQPSSTPNRHSAYSASATPPQPPVPSVSKLTRFQATPPSNLSMPLHHMSPYSGITYHVSVREESQLDGPNVVADYQEVALHELALQQLKTLRITVRRMESMAEHMRSFLAMDILRPLHNQLRDNDAEFVAMRATLLQDPQFSQTVAGTVLAACSPDDPVSIAMKFREHLGSLPPLQGLLEKRRLLDRFLTIARLSDEPAVGPDSFFPVEYVRTRLIALSSDSLMGDYHWDKGVSYKGKEWSSDVAPTDSHLLLHIFAKWVDEQVVPQGSFSRTCLSYRPARAKSQRKLLNSVLIEQTSIAPPYFVVASNADGSVTETHPIPGRHVLFNTLALFIHHVNTFCAGKICRCRIASLAKTRSSRIALQQSENHDGDDLSSDDTDYEY